MRQVILDFPLQFNIGLEAGSKISGQSFKKRYKNIIVCGMGGSGLPGDMLRCLSKLNILSHKSYGLPKQAGGGSLVICVSYSGNTEETISAFKEAKKRGLSLVGVSSGGKLEKLCRKFKVPQIKIPTGIQPRLALGYQFSALIGMLFKLKLVDKKLVNDSLSLKKKLRVKESKKEGKKLAQELKGKIPLVYAADKYQEAAYIWKISLNETAKNPAFSNFFPELCHNEIEMLGKIGPWKGKLVVIILRDKKSGLRMLKKMKIVREMFKEKGVKVKVINIKGKSYLEKVFSPIILGYWTAYYLALENKVDPTSVKIIERLKRMMR